MDQTKPLKGSTCLEGGAGHGVGGRNAAGSRSVVLKWLNRKYLCRNIVDVSWKKRHMFTLGRIFLHLGHSANVTLLKCVYKDNQIPFSLW